ncbi:MAG: hypothetical protein PHU42_02300 [Patescibacteria group bacterium]|nr:hypothetical protein [Patescibacteria group bacterium]
MQGELVTLRMFGTGQVTIPNKWRKQFNTKEFVAVLKGRKITLTPLEMDDDDEEDDDGKWEVLFSAARDGGPIDAHEFLEALRKDIRKEHGSNKKTSSKNKIKR